MATGVTSTELLDLAALEVLEPSVEDRIDIGFAQVMSLIYNRTRGKSERVRRPADFMPRYGPPDHEAMADSLRNRLNLMREVRQDG